VPWSGLCTIVCLTATLANVLNLENAKGSRSFSNMLFGLALAFFLVYAAAFGSAKSASRTGGMLKVLSSRPLAFLGAISYSLYVIHEPVLRTMDFWLHNAGIDAWTAFRAMVVIGVPTSLAAGYGFHLAVERRFQKRPDRIPMRGSPSAQRTPVHTQ
jgi:peptidoglycan/LPS O-acetylase OafA/YrhL